MPPLPKHPASIIDVQRAGPCTGQATRVGSGRYHAGQVGLPRGLPGDRPFALVRPGDVRSHHQGLQLQRAIPGPRLPPRRGSGGPPPGDIWIPDRWRSGTGKKQKGAAPFGTDEEDGVPPMPAFGEGRAPRRHRFHPRPLRLPKDRRPCRPRPPGRDGSTKRY